MRLIAIVFIISMSFLGLNAQITLTNPSFEDEPADATMPMGWLKCAKGTTPDILPGYWGVYHEAQEGETYIGLITRGDGSYESIGQRLPSKLNEGDCYKFSIDLATSDNYSGYSGSVKLRVWLGAKKCNKEQMVYESEFIENLDWETHLIEFNTSFQAKYIIFEAYYQDGSFSHKGNILLDNISPLIYCSRV